MALLFPRNSTNRLKAVFSVVQISTLVLRIETLSTNNVALSIKRRVIAYITYIELLSSERPFLERSELSLDRERIAMFDSIRSLKLKRINVQFSVDRNKRELCHSIKVND